MTSDLSMRAVTGAELEQYIRDSTVQAAFEVKLAPGGSEDTAQRVCDYYNIPKNCPASYVARFVQLAKLAGDARDIVSIQAPHTHWSCLRPIIYKFDSLHNRYIVGLHAVEAGGMYRPVSFIAFDGMVFAYEWLDESVDLPTSLWGEAVAKIYSMLQNNIDDEEPIGLGVDFRFRNDGKLGGAYDDSGSVEFPVHIRNAVAQEFSLIVSGLIAQGIDFGARESLTVGWPCRSIGQRELSAEQLRLLEELNTMLADIPDIKDRAITVSSLLHELHLE